MAIDDIYLLYHSSEELPNVVLDHHIIYQLSFQAFRLLSNHKYQKLKHWL